MPRVRLADVETHLASCPACQRLVAVSNTMLAAPRIQQVVPVKARIGTTLCGKWTVDRFIGAGGMADVFAGTHRNGRRVAIKILKPELAVDPALVRRFVREGYVANRVGNPGAVAVLDDDVASDGAPFLVMELLEGETLAELLARRGPLPLDEVLRLADEWLGVFAAAHAQGIVHRDIKPDNLFVAADGAAKVLDFGIARLREANPSASQAHSLDGEVIGTPGYMAPEQASGQTALVDARTDVWALAATAFVMLTGQRLQKGDTVQALLVLAITTPVGKTSALSPLVPKAIGEVLDKALAFDKTHRFADAAEFRQALREATSVPSLASTVTTLGAFEGDAGATTAKASRRRAVFAGGLGLGALVAVTAALTLRATPERASQASSVVAHDNLNEVVPTASPDEPATATTPSSSAAALASTAPPPAASSPIATPAPSARVEPLETTSKHHRTPTRRLPTAAVDAGPVPERDPLAPRL